MIVHDLVRNPDGTQTPVTYTKFRAADLRNGNAVALCMRGQAISDFPLCNKSLTCRTAASIYKTMSILDSITYRLRHGCATMAYPDGPAPALPDRHGGALRVEPAKCVDGCAECVPVCPTRAITRGPGQVVALDLGRCLFCSACVEVCPAEAITHTGDHRIAARSRGDLVLGEPGEEVRLTAALDEKLRGMFGRSLRLRQVSAGGCNACEADTNVLGTIGWDLGRFGIQFVASPRHADGLLVTGPVTANMQLALEKTYAAVPAPKIVIAVGACAIAGGPWAVPASGTLATGRVW